MSDPVIRLEHVSKIYRLFDSRTHRVLEALHPFRRTYHREFWALRDINLEIPRGCTVGIVGLNGSGKSTLLQIISSVLQPTTGTVTVAGKVAALLELGAGFNPELTARENVIMNGTIMGLNRRQILDRMEEIESFADIGEFFEQPMKIYSSGMFARVAFAAAVHVDPDILIVDEALSVGDAKFCEKCYRKFKSFQDTGRTIMYVTHDRSSIPRLCDLGVILHKGGIVAVGEPRDIANRYDEILATGDTMLQVPIVPAGPGSPAADHDSQSVSASDTVAASVERFIRTSGRDDRCAQNPTYNKYEHRFGNGDATIIDYLLTGGSQVNPVSIESGTELEVLLRVRFNVTTSTPIVGVHFTNREGVLVYAVNSQMLNAAIPPVAAGEERVFRFTVVFTLAPGDWFMDLAVASSRSSISDSRVSLAHLQVIDPRTYVGLVHLQSSFEALPYPSC